MLKKLATIIVIAAVSSSIAAVKVSPNHNVSGKTDADEQWAQVLGYGVNAQNWTNPGNWWHNAVPTASQKAKIDRIPGPIVNSTVDINDLYIGESNTDIGSPAFTGQRGSVIDPPGNLRVISGATLNVRNVLALGYWTADIGTIQVDDGTLNVASHLFVGFEGMGTFIQNGGTVNVGGNFCVSFGGGHGRVELNGGTLNVKQFTYELRVRPKQTPTEPNVYIYSGTASVDISGGQIVHDGNSMAGFYQAMADSGKLTAYNGEGSIVVKYDPVAKKTIVTGQKLLWNYSDITVTSSSVVVDESVYGLDRMFKSNVNDPNAAIFLDNPSGAGSIYFVEWKTPGLVKVNSFEMIANRDNATATPPLSRAVRHFTLKAKGQGSSTYNLVLYSGDISYDSTTNVADVIQTLANPVTAQEFRAEFTGNDALGVRIRELNATGTRIDVPLWNTGDVTVLSSSPVIMDPLYPGMYDLANMFENNYADTQSTIFMDATGSPAVYYVEFRSNVPNKVTSIDLIAEHDNAVSYNQRATKHFKLMAKSLGSSTYDKVLYDADITVPYTGNTLKLSIALTTPVTAQQFRAEFTGNDSYGVRIRELNANGKKGDQLWEPDNIVIGDHASCEKNCGMYDIENAFQREGMFQDPNYAATIFDNSVPESLDFVEWKTLNPVVLTAFQVKSTPDALTNDRAMSHLTLKAKSIGSATFDRVLYDADVTVPYDPNVIGGIILLPAPVAAQEFRAEFTRYSMRVRINELNGIGFKLSATDKDYDVDVDLKDYALLAKNWGIDNSTAPVTTDVVENFESYATTGAMNYPSWANWEDWSGQHSSGWQNYSIDGTVVHSGSKSLKWIYDFDTAPQTADDKAGLVLTLGTPKDLKNYGKFRLWLNRVSGNSLENYIAVKFHYAGDIISDDRAAAQAYILDSAGSTQTPTGWSEWVIDLKNDLAFKSPTTRSVDDLKNIGKIVVYGCSEMQFMGGHGTIYFDDMKLESKCSSPGSDFNGDCKVNFKDLSIFAQNWLGGK